MSALGADGRPIVPPDQRGHGASGLPGPSWAVECRLGPDVRDRTQATSRPEGHRWVQERPSRSFLQDEAVLDRPAIAALAQRIMSDPYRAAFVTRVWGSRAWRVAERLPGAQNDLAQNAALTELPLAAVACPTLIVQSPAPEPARHAEHAATTIPGAELSWIPDGCLSGLWVNDDTREQQQAVLSWLQERTTT